MQVAGAACSRRAGAAAIAQVDDAATEPLGSYVGEAGETIEKLRRDLRGWTNAARGYLAELGLTPAALARISRDSGVGRATRAQAALRELNQHLEANYAELVPGLEQHDAELKS